MAKPKSKSVPHIKYVEHCLELLKARIDECNDYMNTVRWSNKDNQKEMEDEFKFQSGLLNNYISWLNQYSELSGMIDELKELTNTDEDKELRKGSTKSAYAEMVKRGELEEN